MIQMETQFPALNVSGARAAASTAAIEPSVKAAARIAMAALDAEVAKLGRVTGNLAESVGVRTAPTGASRSAVDVGFFGPGAKHAHLVEYGTVLRTRRSPGVASSWNTRGKWVGLGTYPTNFVTRAVSLGAAPAQHPLENARRAAGAAMEKALEAGMARVGERVIAAAVA